MFTLHPIGEDDIQQFEASLGELIVRSEASTAIIIDKGGFVITSQGATNEYDVTTLAALAAASFTANQAIANLIQENNFSSVYQQGEHFSLLVNNVDEHCLLVTVFKAHLSAGAVKYYAATTIREIAAQLIKARARSPSEGLDLSMLNMADPSQVFHRKPA
jgi:predicted regulator of Ras-like GTPase activity (Roadblock/LC7/MglB family)